MQCARKKCDLFGLGGIRHVYDSEPGRAATRVSRRRAGEGVVAALDGAELHIRAALVVDIGNELESLTVSFQRRRICR